jgi:hypothetical protein
VNIHKRNDQPADVIRHDRKYRILDDCARLRDVVEELPEEKRYLPSLLLLVWGAAGSELPSDMKTMV